MADEARILWFDAVGSADVKRVGGKNASLGEMIGALKSEGVRVPDGFATTAATYRDYVSANGIEPKLRAKLETFAAGKASLRRQAPKSAACSWQASSQATSQRRSGIGRLELSRRSGLPTVAVAVRSSATAEDLPQASFAGQQETFLNVRGERDLLDACRRCYASLFTDRAISYRETMGFDHLQVALSIGVQRMVRADRAGSGVMFSIDTETGFPKVVVISAAWGLGETVVQGTVNPDKYLVFKPLLADERFCPIIEKTLGAKERKLVYAEGGSGRTRLVNTTRRERDCLVLSDEEILQARTLDSHYRAPLRPAMDMGMGEGRRHRRSRDRPGAAGNGTISEGGEFDPDLSSEGKSNRLIAGAAIGEAIAAGEVCLIRDAADIARFRDGAITVTEATDPDWVPVMKRAAGIITDHGGATSHAAIVSRELGLLRLVGTQRATEMLRDGQEITMSCAEGEEGYVYEGRLPFEVVELKSTCRTHEPR